MIAQLDNAIVMLKARYHATGIPRFMEWWKGELAPLIPVRIKQLFAVPHEQLLISAAEGNIYLWQASDADIRLLDTLESSHDDEQLRARVVACLDEFKEGTPAAVYCMPADAVLAKPIRMPLAAEANLRQAVAFEVDRQTPFNTQDVYFDLQIIEREPPFLNVEMVLAQRARVDGYIEQMENLGLRLQGIDVDISTAAAAQRPQPKGINLMSRERRVHKANKRVRLNWALAGIVLLLLAVVMTESLYLRGQTIELLQAERDAMRSEALAVSRLRQRLDEALSAANFLAEKRADTPLTLKVLADVTNRIPPDTWVQRFQIHDKELQLQGLSEGAQKLVESLNGSNGLSDTFFKGAISSDQRLNKERFTSASTIKPGAELEPAPLSEGDSELSEEEDSAIQNPDVVESAQSDVDTSGPVEPQPDELLEPEPEPDSEVPLNQSGAQ